MTTDEQCHDEAPNFDGKRRRLSRKEQKARRRKKIKASSSSSAAAVDDDAPSAVRSKQKEIQPPEIAAEAPPLSPSSAATFDPIPIPSLAEAEESNSRSGGGKTTKWFPKAVMMKSLVHPNQASSTTRAASLLLFYQYVEPPWPESTVQRLLVYLQRVASKRVLGGRIRVAREGLNATVSSMDDCNAATAQETLLQFAKDLQQFDSKAFAQTDFKYIHNLDASRHFKELRLLPVQELVFYGFDKDKAPLSKGGTHLKPREFHKMLQQEETVVVDVRNHYEAAIGRFDGQQQTKKKAGATYIDPKMRKSTDFTSWLAQPQTRQSLENKNVLLYCTGGVRCERASAYLNTQMGSNVKGVYQLQGGVEAYLKEFQSADGNAAGFWRGKNFTFDKREAISAANPNGDGGVIGGGVATAPTPKTASGNKRKRKQPDDGISTYCCVCKRPWDRYVGKKKCSTCGVPILMCDGCMSSKKEAVKPLQMRCPLCVEQKVTVLADQVEYTDNGVHGKVIGEPQNQAPGEGEQQQSNGSTKTRVRFGSDKDNGAASPRKSVAAPSVLKWGGGHAASKKERRKMKSIPCRFGSDCRRPDCFFRHPNGTADTACKQSKKRKGSK